MSNEFESFYGFNPNDPSDGPLDRDGDGLTNAEEYNAGTDPLNAASHLRVIAVAGSANNFRVTFSLAVTGKSYRLERKNAVTDAMWNPIPGLPDFTPMQTGSAEIVDALGGPDPQRFYHIPAVVCRRRRRLCTSRSGQNLAASQQERSSFSRIRVPSRLPSRSCERSLVH